MKRRNLFLIIILTLITTLNASAQETCLPNDIITRIVDDLIVKKGLEYKVNKQDSTITILKHDNDLLEQEVLRYKLKDSEYEKIISQLEEIEKVRNAEIKDLKREKTRKTIKTAIVDGLQTAVIVILALLLIK